MRTSTISVLTYNKLSLPKDLESIKIVRVRKDKKGVNTSSGNLIIKYKGAMSAQPLNEIDQQLEDLRNEWEYVNPTIQ